MGKYVDFTIKDDSQLLRLVAQAQNYQIDNQEQIITRLDRLNGKVEANTQRSLASEKKLLVVDTILDILNDDVKEIKKNQVAQVLNSRKFRAIRLDWQTISLTIAIIGGIVFGICKLLGILVGV